MAKTKQIIGRIHSLNRGDFDSETTYSVTDRVYYNGNLYECTQTTTAGILPTDTSYWALLAPKGDQGTPVFVNTIDYTTVGDGKPASAYAANLAYQYINQMVTHTPSDSLSLNDSAIFASSKAAYDLCQAIQSLSVPVGSICYYQGEYWEAEDKSYACPYVKINGVWTVIEDWVFCTGLTKNGITVPDLSGMFIMCASDEYPAGQQHGSDTVHTHIGHTTGPSVTYSSSDTKVAHKHHGVVTSSGTTLKVKKSDSYNSDNMAYVPATYGNATTSTPVNTATHVHPLILNEADSMPSFYRLAFIMKIA